MSGDEYIWSQRELKVGDVITEFNNSHMIMLDTYRGSFTANGQVFDLVKAVQGDCKTIQTLRNARSYTRSESLAVSPENEQEFKTLNFSILPVLSKQVKTISFRRVPSFLEGFRTAIQRIGDYCPNITEINLTGVDIENFGFANNQEPKGDCYRLAFMELANNKNIRRVLIKGKLCSDEAIDMLATFIVESGQLEELDFGERPSLKSRHYEPVLKSLRSCHSLQVLKLSVNQAVSNGILDNLVEIFRANPAINEFVCLGIDRESDFIVRQRTHFDWAQAANPVPVDPDQEVDWSILLRNFEHLSQVEKWNFANSRLKLQHLSCFKDLCTRNFKEIILKNNNLEDTAAEIISQFIANKSFGVELIDLRQNKFSHVGQSSIAKAWRANPRVYELEMGEWLIHEESYENILIVFIELHGIIKNTHLQLTQVDKSDKYCSQISLLFSDLIKCLESLALKDFHGIMFDSLMDVLIPENKSKSTELIKLSHLTLCCSDSDQLTKVIKKLPFNLTISSIFLQNGSGYSNIVGTNEGLSELFENNLELTRISQEAVSPWWNAGYDAKPYICLVYDFVRSISENRQVFRYFQKLTFLGYCRRKLNRGAEDLFNQLGLDLEILRIIFDMAEMIVRWNPSTTEEKLPPLILHLLTSYTYVHHDKSLRIRSSSKSIAIPTNSTSKVDKSSNSLPVPPEIKSNKDTTCTTS
jgi:hypothetical protein